MAADDQRWVPIVSVMAAIGICGGLLAAVAGAVILALFLLFVSGIGALLVTPAHLINRRWHPGEITFPGGVFEIGSQTTVRYTRRPKKQMDLPDGEASFELVCEERATYTVGTTTRTDTSKVVTRKFSGRGAGTSIGYVADIPMEIPVDAGAPSMDLGHNEVRWSISVKVRAKGVPERGGGFTVIVGPVLASTVIDRFGDR